MADDTSTTIWRLGEVEKALRDLGQRVVSADLYARDLAELQRDVADIRRELAEEKLARKEADKDEEDDRKEDDKALKAQLDKQADKQGTNWRQAVYSGLVPGVLFLIGILLQLKSGSGK